MSNSIEKYKLEEKIRTLFLKNAGNIEKVAKDADIPYEYALKLCKKFKQELLKDRNKWIGTSIAGYVMVGSEERKIHLRDQLNDELNRKPLELSSCCKMPVAHECDSYGEYTTCRKCENVCNIVLEDTKNVELVLQILEQLRIEDTATVASIIKLGIIKDAQPPAIKVQQNTIVLGNPNDVIVQDIQQLNPMKQIKLMEQLRNQITDAKFEEKNDQQPEQKTE